MELVLSDDVVLSRMKYTLDTVKQYTSTLALRVLGCIVTVCLLRNIDAFVLAFSYNQLGIVPVVIAVLVLMSGVLACVGLLNGRHWGFLPLYFFIPAATMFFSFSLVPFVPLFFPVEIRAYIVLALNISILLYAVFLLLKKMDSPIDLHSQ